MPKYTPGPWKLDKRVGCVAVYPEKDYHNCLSGADEYCVHYMHGGKDPKGDWFVGEEIIANARLIAAAPDLLEELRHLVKLLEPFEFDGGMNIPGLATLNGARAAIAKAEGNE